MEIGVGNLVNSITVSRLHTQSAKLASTPLAGFVFNSQRGMTQQLLCCGLQSRVLRRLEFLLFVKPFQVETLNDETMQVDEIPPTKCQASDIELPGI